MEQVCESSVGKTLRNETIHLFASVVVCAGFYWYNGDFVATLAAFFSAMLLDVDHLFDYSLYLFQSREAPKVSEFISGAYFKKWQRFVCPFHAWELAALLLILWAVQSNVIFLGLAVGLVTHLVLDYWTNTVNRVAYFFSFRLYHRFSKPAIAPRFLSLQVTEKSAAI